MNIKKYLTKGTSNDAVLLIFVRLITMFLGLVSTRLLSEFLSVHDYGTYSQILLIISTVSSFTILGMMDGVNYFYCEQTDEQKKESHVATIFLLQILVGSVSGIVVMVSGAAICSYFENSDLKGVLIFSAVLPVMQNMIGMLQVLLVSVGKARMLAIRNFVISLLRLSAIVIILHAACNIALILTVTLVLDILQVLFFVIMLRKNGCHIRFRKADFRLAKRILNYCLPMAVFTAVSALNRDIDKYLISLMTDTETLAIYANASKPLPFDIIMLSFCTVLLPYITRFIANKESEKACELYKRFLEIAYVSTGVLCCAAIAVAQPLMNLLYTEKYEAGLSIFVVYILVDLARITNLTLVLSAAGKTKWLMITGVAAVGVNTLLNVVMFKLFGIIGPAVATLLVTVLLGIVMMSLCAKVLNTKLLKLFSMKYLTAFVLESAVLTVLLNTLAQYLSDIGWNNLLVFVLVAGMYGLIMLVLHGKRVLRNLKQVNLISKQE